MKASHRDAIGLGFALGAALLAHRFVLGLELMGWDSYPTLAASRVTGVRDLIGTFGEELMGGRYPDGRFYRPVVHLLFALDHAVWGLRPVGYQLTNLSILLAGVVAVFVLARRWLGPGWGPAVAAAVFALHPLQLETVPVAARRADMLFTLFLVVALALLPLGARASRRALVGVALAVLLSAASKETGAVALPVVLAALWLLPDAPDTAARTRLALVRGAPAAFAFALFLLARTAVLGGLGGHPGSSLGHGALAGLAQAPEYARALLLPQPWLGRPLGDLLLAAALGVALLAALAACVLRGGGRPGPARLGLLLGFWLLCLLAMHGVSGERASWYAVPFLPAYALLLGQLAAAAARAARERRLVLAAGAGAVVVALAGSHLRFSALVQPYPQWQEVSGQASRFLAGLEDALRAAGPGSRLRVEGLPLGTGTPLEAVGVRSALCLADYSVEAWAELAFPDLPVEVRLDTGGGLGPPAPGRVTVDAVPLPSPVLRPAPSAS